MTTGPGDPRRVRSGLPQVPVGREVEALSARRCYVQAPRWSLYLERGWAAYDRNEPMCRLIVMCVVASCCLLPAQRPPAVNSRGTPAVSRPSGRATPPASSAAYRTAQARKVAAGRRLEAEKRRGVRGEGNDHDADDMDPNLRPRGPAPGGGAFPDRGPLRRFAAAEGARRLRDFVGKLDNRIERTRDELRVWDITAFDGGLTRRVRLDYFALRLPDGKMRHRVIVREVTAGKLEITDQLLIEETPGELPRGWRSRGGVVMPYFGNVFLHPVVGGGHPLVLHDLLPFHPKRYALELVGEGERDGRPVLHFNARALFGRRESQDLVFRKITRLLVRSTAHSKGSVIREVVASVPKRRAGRLGFDKLSLRFRVPPGVGATVSLIERKINSKLEPGLFDPGRFR